MVTLTDVAKKAVVSKMTVSRVLNHPDKVSTELRDLVYQAMKELNYVPNFAARALVHNRTQVIKLLILEEMDTTEPYYMNLLTGVATELDVHHYALQLVTRNSHQISRSDGVIVTGMRCDDYDSIIDKINQPIVLFGQNNHGYDFVDVDNEMGIKKAVQHVIDLGFERIILFAMDVTEPFMEERIKGYQRVMAAFDFQQQIYKMKNSSHVAEARIIDIFQEIKQKTAIVCATDRMAIGVVRGVQQLGLEIPKQVAVTGFDGVFLDRIASPKLTTVRQPVIEMGQELAKMLLRKIDLDGGRIGSRIFQPELIVRASTVG
ncbi:MAG: LacI family DNA-binding transcriptional regulator [Sporolactobacillus sp.]